MTGPDLGIDDFEKRVITIRWGHESEMYIEAHCLRDWAVHPQFVRQDCFSDDQWAITNIPTGLAVPFRFRDKLSAVRAVRKVVAEIPEITGRSPQNIARRLKKRGSHFVKILADAGGLPSDGTARMPVNSLPTSGVFK